jgi:hypothetical protein
VKPEIREKLLFCVEAALECSVTIDPGLLENYVHLWRQDLRDWQRRLATIGKVSTPEVALKELGLEQRAAVGWPADVAAPSPEALAEESPGTSYAYLDLYEVLGSGADAASRTVSGPGKRGGSNSGASVLLHHGSSSGVREGGRLASAALRSFRALKRGYAPMEPSPARDAASGAPM